MDIRAADLRQIYTDVRKFFPGQEVLIDGKKFRFVRYNSGAGAIAAVAGQVGYYVSGGTTDAIQDEVTMDYDSNAAGTAITMTEAPAGFFQAALTDGTYGFIQVSGWSEIAALTDGNVAAGNRCSIGTTDGEIIPLADGTPPLPVVGTARNDDTTTSLAAGDLFITIPMRN